jgi:hypothetical protein
MDVDASERRPGGGRRGSHEEQVMDKPSELYKIQEPETPVKRPVLHLTDIRPHNPVDPRPLGRPWPQQVDWQEFRRRSKKSGF